MECSTMRLLNEREIEFSRNSYRNWVIVISIRKREAREALFFLNSFNKMLYCKAQCFAIQWLAQNISLKFEIILTNDKRTKYFSMF